MKTSDRPAHVKESAKVVTILLISIVIFLLILAAGYAGLHVQKRLADGHKTGSRAASSVRWRGCSPFSWRWSWER